MIDPFVLLVVNAGGLVAALSLLFWLLATGRLATGRELTEKNGRIADLEKMVSERDAQIAVVMAEYLPAANSVMKALHAAAIGDDAP